MDASARQVKQELFMNFATCIRFWIQVGLFVCSLQIRAAGAQGTAFTYQGLLTDDGIAPDGNYDFRFRIFGAVSNGSQLGSALIATPVLVTAGRFNVSLDFEAGIFTGSDRWLEIGVRTNGSAGNFTTLSPRQAITPTPYAIRAALAGSVPNGAINSDQLAAGAAAANLSASGLSGVASGGVILSTNPNSTSLAGAGYVKFGMADFTPDAWRARASDAAPSGRAAKVPSGPAAS